MIEPTTVELADGLTTKVFLPTDYEVEVCFGDTLQITLNDYPDDANPYRALIQPLIRDHNGILVDTLADEREKLVSRITAGIDNLYSIHRGQMVAYYEYRTEITQRNFKNGKPRKTPIVTTEKVPVSGGPTYFSRNGVNAEIIKTLQLLADSHNQRAKKQWFLDRLNLLDCMLQSPDNELTVTLCYHPRLEGSIGTKGVWNVPPFAAPACVRSATVFGELGQFFPSYVRKMFWERLSEFKWVYREGFCRDFWCPQDYWNLMKFRLQAVDVEMWHEAWVNGVEEGVHVRWGNSPIQPLERVFFSDAPELPPIIPRIYHPTHKDQSCIPYIGQYLPKIISYDQDKRERKNLLMPLPAAEVSPTLEEKTPEPAENRTKEENSLVGG